MPQLNEWLYTQSNCWGFPYVAREIEAIIDRHPDDPERWLVENRWWHSIPGVEPGMFPVYFGSMADPLASRTLVNLDPATLVSLRGNREALITYMETEYAIARVKEC